MKGLYQKRRRKVSNEDLSFPLKKLGEDQRKSKVSRIKGMITIRAEIKREKINTIGKKLVKPKASSLRRSIKLIINPLVQLIR